ncbi:MAG: ABC transporter substrate-binding protein [Terriglobales bacterium]
MNRRETLLALLALGAASVPFACLAQPKGKLWRVGFFLSGSRRTGGANEAAFLAGMKDHGYEVGRNLIVDTRYAEADPARYPAIADELIALMPDVLLVSSTGNAIVMKSKTTTIPIVLGSVGDPVGDGLAQSLARPGGNVTGNSLQLFELGAKKIELMTEVLPGMRRVAVLTDLSQTKSARDRYEQVTFTAATAKGLMLELHRVDGLEAIRRAFRKLETQRSDALLISPSPPFNRLRQEICRGAASIRLPAIGFSDEWAQDGALMSFGPSFVEMYRRAASFVDRILKGAKPADLPLEQPTKFDLVINARTAKALGIKIPGSILIRADRVIE